ncbi:hypothetical protein DL93DRAFT_2187833 [Clavulina sp. PMI_390]|nr:hypothetical protein DL93DRAFT_2187833 [Clavulina sp. PMI_390]
MARTSRRLHTLMANLCFTNAYEKGLTGSQAAWAAKKYRSHRVIPDRILDELEKAEIT